MSTITTRAGKGSPLTNTEVDTNFTNLNTDKLETSGGTLTGNLTISSSGTPQLTLHDSGNGSGGAATHRIDFENTDGVSTAILIDSSDTTNSDLVITNNHASGHVDDTGITDTTSDIVLYPLTHVRIASGDLQMGTTTVIDSSRNATFQTLKIESNTVSTTSDIALTANAAINAVNSMSFGMTDDTGSYFRWMFGNDSNIGGTAGGVEKMKLNHNGNLTLSGSIDVDGLATLNSNLAMVGTSPTISLIDSTTNAHDYYVHANTNNFYILADRDGTNPGTINTGFESPHPLRLNTDDDRGYLFGERMFAEDYHPNADKWTSARTLTLTGDVTGSVSWDGSANASLAATVGNDSHTHTFNNLTDKLLGTGEYSTDGYITAGRGSGGVSLTNNDGYGNANITFNHKAGIPEQNGSALRIETNTDTSGKGLFSFEASGAAVTAGTAVNLPTLGTWDVDVFKVQTDLLVSHVPTSAQSGIIYPAIIEAKDSGNVNDYALTDGVGIQFKIGTNGVGSPSEYSQVGASIAAIREATTDTASNTGLGLFISQNNETLDEALRIDNVGNADFKLGTLKMGGTALVTQDRDVTPRKVNIVSSENDALKLGITDNVADRARNAMHIDFNVSGADACTADRVKAALRIDLDSTATGGDTNHEHRVYGIVNDVRTSGDSDVVYGQNNYVETQHSAGTTGIVYGDYTIVVVDETGSGVTNTATGTYGAVSMSSSGTGAASENIYGGYFRSLCGGTLEKNITNMHGMMAEVEIDNSANGVTVDNAFVIRSYYDNDVISTGDVVVTNSYLFHGAYAGNLPNNPYGVYISTDVPNFFRGNVEVRGSDGLEVSNATDTHLKVQTRTDVASDYGMMRFYGRDAAEVGFVIGYGSSHSSNPHQIALKASNAAGTVGFYTNGTERVHIANARTTVTTPMVVNPAVDVTLTGTTHAFQIGAVGGANMRFDTNEILCVTADGTSHDLRLQHEGGKVLVNNDLILEGHKIATNGSTLDISVDNDANSSNQQIRFLEGGIVRMVLEDNDLYVHDNINAGYKYESNATNKLIETTSSHVSSYSSTVADGSGVNYRTFIQSYNTTDPDVAVFQCFSKNVMDATNSTTHDHKATAHLLDNGGRLWSWHSHYAGRVRVGSTATSTAYRSADSGMTAYTGTGNAHGHTTHAGYTQIVGRESANSDIVFQSVVGTNVRHRFTAAGNAYNDGVFSTSNADYAEFFEWVDGNPDNEDRRGHAVVLTTDGKIRIATSGDNTSEFLGIISVESGVVGDSAWASWTGMHERDRFGQTVYEDYELLCWGPYDEDNQSYETQTTRQAMIDAGREGDIPEDAITVTKSRKKFAANYDPDREYIARSDRPEWSAVGLMGKLPLFKGQPTAPQWRKLFDLNDEVEMWLVR